MILETLSKYVNKTARNFSREDKEDILQEACVLYFSHPSDAPTKALLYKIARLATYNYIYKPNRGGLKVQEVAAAELPDTPYVSDVEDVINYNQIKKIIFDIKKLTPLQRNVLMKVLNGAENKDLASRTEQQVCYQAYHVLRKSIKKDWL